MAKGKEKKQGLRLGIMGGTFNPIHHGHLVMAEEVRNKFALDKVIFVPTGNPPHKQISELVSAQDRYLMTVLATMTNLYFEVSNLEIEREGVSYTIDTIKEFKKVYGKNTKIYFITGADAILSIFTWKNMEDLLESCSFIAATRPGYCLDELKTKIEAINPAYIKHIHLVEVPGVAVSSTDVRERIRDGKPIKYLMPETVESYIIKNKLYQH